MGGRGGVSEFSSEKQKGNGEKVNRTRIGEGACEAKEELDGIKWKGMLEHNRNQNSNFKNYGKRERQAKVLRQ